MLNFNQLKNNFFIMAGPNVIESEEHVLKMAHQIKAIMDKHNVTYISNLHLIKPIDRLHLHIGV